MNKSILKAFLAVLAIGMIFILVRPSPIKPSPQMDEEEESHIATPYLDAEPAEPATKSALPLQSATSSIKPPVSSPHSDEVLRRWQSILPKTGSLKFETHLQAQRIHPAVLRAGKALGELKELWLKDSSKRPLAFEMYQRCTLDFAVVESVRALCYVNAMEISIYLKKTDQVLAWNVGPAVQSLASRWISN